MLLRLDPPIPVFIVAPDRWKGDALAHILIDYGIESDLIWVCAAANGECYCAPNTQIRFYNNATAERSYPK